MPDGFAGGAAYGVCRASHAVPFQFGGVRVRVCRQMESLQQGDRVKVTGLLSKTELNGQRGTITAPLRGGRFNVLLDGGTKPSSIKPSNLLAVSTSFSGAGEVFVVVATVLVVVGIVMVALQATNR